MSVMLDLDLADDLRGAHERGEIVLHFQPEIDLASGGVVGMEALMRWAHPRRGLLPPSSFLEVAHKAGLLLPLSTWVLEQCAAERATLGGAAAASDASACASSGRTSPRCSSPHPASSTSVRELFDRHQLPPRSLGLEFSESTLGDVGSPRRPTCSSQLREVGLRAGRRRLRHLVLLARAFRRHAGRRGEAGPPLRPRARRRPGRRLDRRLRRPPRPRP